MLLSCRSKFAARRERSCVAVASFPPARQLEGRGQSLSCQVYGLIIHDPTHLDGQESLVSCEALTSRSVITRNTTIRLQPIPILVPTKQSIPSCVPPKKVGYTFVVVCTEAERGLPIFNG